MRLATCTVVVALLASLGPAGAGAGGSGRSVIDGRWTWTWTAADMKRAGANAHDRKTLLGPETCIFADGRFEGRNLSSGRRDGGRFTVHGSIVTLALEYGPGSRRVVELRFSIYRDRLTWSTIPGRAGWSLFPTTPWVRAG
jgi:hypothetical protein